MADCKLTYFTVRALGESIRMILIYMKVPYEEVVVDYHGPEWPKLKPKVPMGQLPVLEIDGLVLHQSRAICRYLARKCGLDGDNDKETVQIDIAADVIYDFLTKLRSLNVIEDPEMNLKKYEEFKATDIPLFLNTLDSMVKDNGGYFACGKLTWIDIYFAGANDYFTLLSRFNILEDYKNLKAVVDKVFSLPELQKYLKFRPNAEY